MYISHKKKEIFVNKLIIIRSIYSKYRIFFLQETFDCCVFYKAVDIV